MQPTLCAKCKKNVAVVFVQRIENGETKSEGLCLNCAREMGIKPVDDMIQKMGLSDDDVQSLTSEMMSAFGGAEGMPTKRMKRRRMRARPPPSPSSTSFSAVRPLPSVKSPKGATETALPPPPRAVRRRAARIRIPSGSFWKTTAFL